MLRKIRIILAAMFLIGITLLFIGIGQDWWGWMAQLQFIPAVYRVIGGAVLGNIAVLAGILLVTLLFGRIYCSVICPLGVFQDLIIFIRRKFSKKVFKYTPECIWRHVILVALVVCTIIFSQIVISLVAPYSAYGRIVGSIVTLVSGGSIAMPLLLTALATFVLVFICAWFWGRAWCNTVCPVGTVLGWFSRFSLFRVKIDTDKCKNCGSCVRQCKSSCINMEKHSIDGSRCVDCFDCIGACKFGAISFGTSCRKKAGASAAADDGDVNNSRRRFLGTTAMLAGATVVSKAQDMKFDGGLAELEDKQEPERMVRLVPFGALSVKNFYDHCTACQLCVSACPNKVLRPSTDPEHFLQPKMGYENGYCRPECTACSDICPSGAIRPIQKEEKLGMKIGTARLNADLCLAATGQEKCGNCAAHCPVGAIGMVEPQGSGFKRPVIYAGHCIGCGACENLCPVRPISAITVDGIEIHRNR